MTIMNTTRRRQFNQNTVAASDSGSCVDRAATSGTINQATVERFAANRSSSSSSSRPFTRRSHVNVATRKIALARQIQVSGPSARESGRQFR